MGKDLLGREIGTNIRQLPNGKYTARYYDKIGNRKQIYDWDLKELRKRLNVCEYDVANDNTIVDETTTLTQWFEQWLNVHKYKIISPNTRRHYIYVYNDLIKPVLGHRRLNQITQLDIKSLLRTLDENGYKFSSKDRARIMLNDMFNKALIDNYVKRNPVKGIKVPKEDTGEPRVLTEEEQVLFFDASKGTFYDNFFVTAVNTGLRQGELAALTWADIDFENKFINVNKTLVYQKLENDNSKTFHVGPPKTPSSVRKVPINRQAEIALKKQYLLRNNVWSRDCARINESCGDLVFVTKLGGPINDQNVCDAIKRVLAVVNEFRDEAEEIPYFSSHCFRHTFATRCFEGGVAMKTVQKLLGHASIQMTMDLYTHILDKHETQEMEKMQTEFDRVMNVGDSLVDKVFKETIEEENKRNKVIVDLDSFIAARAE